MMDNLTLEKIADLAGVSRSTASRVLRKQGSVSQRARESVMRVVEETGFQPNAAARSLAGHRTNIISLYISEVFSAVFNDPYFGRLIEGVSLASNQADQTLTLFLLHDEGDAERTADRIAKNPLVDGVIISNTDTTSPIIPRLLERNMPFVVVGRHEDPRVSFVDSDNLGGAYMAITHLIRQGYSHIGTITGPMTNPSAIDRLEGYKDAHQAKGRVINEDLIYYGTFTKDSGYDGAKVLLKEKVDAIFAASDSIAIGALEAILEAGLRVPEDVAVIGFDDLPFARFLDPPLATVRQSIRQAGKTAVDLLLTTVADPQKPVERVVLPTDLVLRRSCTSLSSSSDWADTHDKPY